MARVGSCLAFILVLARGDTCQGVMVTSVTSLTRAVRPTDPDIGRGYPSRIGDTSTTKASSPVDTDTGLSTPMALEAEVTLINVLLTVGSLEAGGAGARVWSNAPASVVTGRIANG